MYNGTIYLMLYVRELTLEKYVFASLNNGFIHFSQVMKIENLYASLRDKCNIFVCKLVSEPKHLSLIYGRDLGYKHFRFLCPELYA